MIPSKQFQNKMNLSRILNLLWRKQPLSRTDLARELNLDKSTITDAIQKLLELDLVEEWKQGESSPGGGRKPVFLRICQGFGVAVGIEFRPEGYRVSICTMQGAPISGFHNHHEVNPENIISHLADVISEVMDYTSKRNHRVIGIGIGITGIIDATRGWIHHSIPFHIQEPLNVTTPLMEKHQVPILLENDANACAWAELGFQGSIHDQSLPSDTENQQNLPNSFITVLGEMPVLDTTGKVDAFSAGLGLCLNQRIYRGSNFYAGEFRSLNWQGEHEGQFSIPKVKLPSIRHDPETRHALFEEFASQIALFSNTLDCDAVYICGDLEGYSHEFLPILDKHIRTNWSYESIRPRKISLQVSSHGENAVPIGAAAMVLHNFFSVPDYGTDSGSQNAQFRDVILNHLQESS